jgi:hypothetical protein
MLSASIFDDIIHSHMRQHHAAGQCHLRHTELVLDTILFARAVRTTVIAIGNQL